jgi:hypothetical protein
LCQIIGARFEKPICRHCSWIEAWSGTTVCCPPFLRRERHTSPTTQTNRPPGISPCRAQ